MADANFAVFYIISSLNPFAYSVSSFHLFSFTLGFLTFILFGLTLYKKDNYNNLIINFSISSIILILPFFITRAYWGTSSGLAWFLLVCLVFYFNEIKALLIKNENINIAHIFIICLLSSLLLYVRASYVFFALYLFLYFLLIIKKNHITLASLIFFSFFSIPGFYLIYIWVNQPLNNINVTNVISLKNIFLNFPIFTSYFAFYLFPILFIGIKYLNKNIFYKYLKIFSLVFFVYLILFMMGKFEYLSNYEFSGGAILKLNYILIDGNYLLLLISSIIGCCLLSNFLMENFRKYYSYIAYIFNLWSNRLSISRLFRATYFNFIFFWNVKLIFI